jgi:hypothetical protein
MHITDFDLQRAETDFFDGEPLRALSTLVYSENVDLQRSASLTFAEITERGTYHGANGDDAIPDILQMSARSTAILSSRYYSSFRAPISKYNEPPVQRWVTSLSMVGSLPPFSISPPIAD